MSSTILHLYLVDKYQCNRIAYYDCNMDTFGSRLRALREKHGWSQEDLAKAAKVSQSTIAQIEGGRNKGSRHILALAGALEVPPEWLQDGIPLRAVITKTELDGLTYRPPPESKAPERSRAAQDLMDAIALADERGMSEEAFKALRETLRLLARSEPLRDPDEPFDGDGPRL
ncbi:helix-turn-helix domain-containing protein [Burkholderia cenocepacia]|uniref:helix-turn-helix domain-containing protein n=1 Tax=Burkholderia cenocepacia TaxID=95486 RepID=UPI002650520C|nr:helix-turn-helix domain-containing protein [Burkholderia cenocepacia]MDN7544786.1 helix-turn-helix domain-containing protein [Burkholderia cenocepacia]MDN7626963.1 helix-turn-helix domain-containing protein [Burkholderia cenocepacia]